MAVLHTRNVPTQVRFLVDAFAAQIVALRRSLTIQQMPWDRGVMAACLALNEVGRGSSPRGPNRYLWRSLAAHHLAMVKAPVQIRLGTLVGLMVQPGSTRH